MRSKRSASGTSSVLSATRGRVARARPGRPSSRLPRVTHQRANWRSEPPCGVGRCVRAAWFVVTRAARRQPRSDNLRQGSVRLGSSNSTMSAANAARSWSSTCASRRSRAPARASAARIPSRRVGESWRLQNWNRCVSLPCGSADRTAPAVGPSGFVTPEQLVGSG